MFHARAGLSSRFAAVEFEHDALTFAALDGTFANGVPRGRGEVLGRGRVKLP